MNKNAVAKRAVDWKQTTTAEIKALLAMTIISNDLLVVLRDERYFLSGGNTSVFHTTGIRNIFSLHKCYFDLKKYISFVDPDHEKTEEEARDVLYKIRNISRTITQKFFDLYNCHESVSVDEGMVPFKGRLKIKVRMPDKPVKYGIKLFMLCDSTNGYCKKFDVYVGSDERNAGNLGKTGKTVLNLLQGLENTHHRVYMDNFYTSPILFLAMKNITLYGCGTVRNCKGFPMNELKAVQTRQRGDIAWLSWNGSMLALKWKDRKEISALSTIHSSPVPRPAPRVRDNEDGDDEEGDDATVTRRVKERAQWRQVTISCPHLIKDYNKFMGGVDLHDQMTSVNKSKKQIRWYMRMFAKLLQICVFNAYVIEFHYQAHQGHGHRKRDLLSFKQELCIQLIGDFPTTHENSHKRRRSLNEYPERMDGVGEHIVCRGDCNDHRCAVCLKKQQEFMRMNRGVRKKDCPFKDKKSTFKCMKCNVYLCIGKDGSNCFFDYHPRLQYWL